MAKAATYYGTGRRKSSVARVFMTPGKGDITINGRTVDDYFGLETLKVIMRQPLVATQTSDQYDFTITYRSGRRDPPRYRQSALRSGHRVQAHPEEARLSDP